MADGGEDLGTVPGLPRIELGWVVADRGADTLAMVEEAARLLCDHLADQFPGFSWGCPVVAVADHRPTAARRDPLRLLQLGCREKVARGWDLALVVAEGELRARTKPFIAFGVPSSAMETAVLAAGELPEDGDRARALAGVARFMFKQLLGLPWRPGDGREKPTLESVADERAQFEQRLHDVADTRLEEMPHRPRGRVLFSLRAFAADWRGILTDVIGYRPWYQPLQLPTLTASAFLSSFLLFLGEEAWRIGVGLDPWVATVAAFLAVAGATVFLYRGQNLGEVSSGLGLREQLVRARLVLLLSVLVGMASLWCLLFVAALAVGAALPGQVIANWVSAGDAGLPVLAKFAVFTATLGTLAGSLGGNLENGREFSARYFFDREY